MSVVKEIEVERKRQVKELDYTTKHDDKLTDGQLIINANVYIKLAMRKTGDMRVNLIKAAALLVAEIERLDRIK